MSRFFLVLTALMCTWVGTAQAELIEELKSDFSPVEGVVIMPVDGEFLIDADASKGVVPGDLFTVVRSGEKIIHPVTGEVLGTLDETKGILRVTRIKAGYSYAVPVGDAGKIKRGDPIRRYGQVPAAFRDSAQAGESFQQKLQTALPHLEWQNYESVPATRPGTPNESPAEDLHMAFVLTPESLKVLGPAGEVIHTYPAPLAAKETPVHSPSASVAGTPTVAGPAPGATAGGIVPVAPEVATGGIIRRQEQLYEGIWSAADLEGNPNDMTVADLNGDGRLELAVLFSQRLVVGRIADGSFQKLDEIAFDGMEKSLHVAAADLDEDLRNEIYITAARAENSEARLSSRVVVLKEGHLTVVEELIPWYFRSVDWPGEGPILIAQRMGDGHRDFVGPLFRVHRQGGQVAEGPAVNVPGPISLYGFIPFAVPDTGLFYAYLDRTGTLMVIAQDGEVLWQSAQDYGGSEVFFERFDPAAGPEGEKRAVFIKPDLSLAESGEILVPVNEGWTVTSRFRELGPSHLSALQWDGHTLREVWRTQPQEGYMSGYDLADIDHDGASEVAMSVVFSRPAFLGAGRSGIIIYEME